MTSDYNGILNNYADLPNLVRAFGAFFLKPTTLNVLKETCPGVFNSLKIADGNTRLYLVGFAVNLCTFTHSSAHQVLERYIPIDSFNAPYGWSFNGPISLMLVYSDGLYRNYTALNPTESEPPYVREVVRSSTTKALEQLIKVVGIRKSLPKGGEFSVGLAQLWGADDAVAPPIKPKKVSLSRDEIVAMLKTERERAIREGSQERTAMYDAVIKLYETYTKQGKDGKLVRMADGTRKWMPLDKAAKFLKLPVHLRIDV